MVGSGGKFYGRCRESLSAWSSKQTGVKGKNPFDSILTDHGEKLSKYVDCYDPGYTTSKNVYKDINDNLEILIEDAISRKGSY